ncbi:hypothetical protein ACIHCX_03265 [Streptomyces sp. NPDC052043]|uniref:hypothetical protein n=1 Tax=Streptomyces sp. NPDC052043 TaxID=3365684 RepID=UPI0037CEDA1D
MTIDAGMAGGTLCSMDKRSLEQMAQRYRKAMARTEILRQELAAAICMADADDVPQKDICEATGYTRQQVRRIVLAGEPEDDGATPPAP